MLRMLWLGHLFGALIISSAVHRVALATPAIDDHSRQVYYNFSHGLIDIGVSKKIMSFSWSLYKLFSITQLSLTYGSYRAMESILDSSWEKNAVLSSKMTDQQKIKINEALLQTPLRGNYYNQIDKGKKQISHTAPHQSLVIFFSSHPEPMLENLSNLKKIIKNITSSHFFPANVLLVSSTTTYNMDELSNLEPNRSLSEDLSNLLHNKQRISQAELATEMLWQLFRQWVIITTIQFDSTQHFSQELENALSEPRNVENYSNVILATLQPYCEEAKVIIRNKLKHKYTLHHSCLDFYTTPLVEYQSMDIIADSLNALRHLIKTENRYYNLNENVRY